MYLSFMPKPAQYNCKKVYCKISTNMLTICYIFGMGRKQENHNYFKLISEKEMDTS